MAKFGNLVVGRGKRHCHLQCGFAVLLLALTSTVYAELVVNGGFEDPVVTVFPTEFFTAPSAADEVIPGWRASSLSQATINPGTLPVSRYAAGGAYEGLQFANLSPAAGSDLALRQTVRVEQGATYRFSFSALPHDSMPAHTANIGWAVNYLVASGAGLSPQQWASGLLLEDPGVDILANPLPWRVTSLDFVVDPQWRSLPGGPVGTADITILFFSWNASNAFSTGNFLDAVSVQRVPSPGTLPLLGAALVAFGLGLRTRCRSGGTGSPPRGAHAEGGSQTASATAGKPKPASIARCQCTPACGSTHCTP